MGKTPNYTLTLTNDDSGQKIKGRFVPYSQGGKFMKLWQGTGWERRIKGLQGNSLRVLWYLVSVASWNNEVQGPSDTAIGMNLRQPHISRAYGELIKADFLYKVNGIYHLSPYFCWKGDDYQYQQACRELSMTSVAKQLVEVME